LSADNQRQVRAQRTVAALRGGGWGDYGRLLNLESKPM
jgi:hypothetical protein